MPDVFISYSQKDSKRVLQVVEWLQKQGISVFVDNEGLGGGDEISGTLAQGIKRSSLVIVFLSKHSLASKWVSKEVYFALERGIPVLPVRLDDVVLPDAWQLLIGPLYQITFHDGTASDKLAEIMAALSRNGIGPGAGGEQSVLRVRRKLILMGAAVVLLLFSAAFMWWSGLLGPNEKGEFQVNEVTEGDQNLPCAVALPDGGYAIAWQSKYQDGSDTGIYARLFDSNGQPRGGDLQVNTYTSGRQGKPAIALLSNERLVVTWISLFQDGSGEGVFCQLLNLEGSKLGAEFPINSKTTGDQSLNAIAPLPGGGFVVAWQSASEDGDGWGVVAQVFDAEARLEGDAFQVNETVAGKQKFPAVASNSGGLFAIAWESESAGETSYDIVVRLHDKNAKPVTSELRANTFTGNWQRWPAIASLGERGFIITWSSEGQDGSGGGVFGQRFDWEGTPTGREFQANTFVEGNQWVSSVAGFPDGGYVVCWSSDEQDGSGLGAYCQVYTPDGNRSGSEVQLNTHTQGDQVLRSVAAFADGRYLATWQSDAQDGSGSGVFARVVR